MLEIRPKKRIFIGLLAFTCIILLFLIFLLWYVPIVGLRNIHPTLPVIFSFALASLIFLMIFGGLLLVFTIMRGKDIFLSHRLRGLVAKVLFSGHASDGKDGRYIKRESPPVFRRTEQPSHSVERTPHPA